MTQRIPRAVSFLAIAACAVAALAQTGSGPSGHWEGTIDVPNQPINVIVDLAGKAGEAWQGAVSIPSQNVRGFPLSSITVDGSAVSFLMKGIPGEPTFKGTTSADGKTITGEYSQAGTMLPFTLAWKGEAKLEPAVKSAAIGKEFEGTWKGPLQVGSTTLNLIVTLSNADGSAHGTLVSVDQGGVEISIAPIVQTGSHLKLVVSPIGGTFEGDLKDEQLTGTWTQGSAALPLVLSRAAK
jgi:uncharacterized protein